LDALHNPQSTINIQQSKMIDKPFIPAWTELRAFSPELWLIGTIIAVLLAPFFARKSNVLCALVALIGLSLALISALVVGTNDIVGPHLRGLLIADHMTVLWKVLLLIFTIGIIFMWFSTTANTMHEGDGPEFFTLLLGATLGMCLMAGTNNLLMIFMCVELASLPSYVLAGFRKTNRIGAEASLKYVLFGAATSAIMAYGLSILYGLYGTLQVDELAAKMTTGSATSVALLSVAFAGLLIGVGFKISLVPVHFWCPDVFEGASIDVSAFLSVASKGAGIILLLRVLMSIAEGLGFQSNHGVSLSAIAAVVGVLGAITATVGNTAAFVQNNIKRLLAYSSIAHAGYMLCTLSLLVKHNSSRSLMEQAASAILIYLAIYLFMNLGAFTVAGLISRETGSEDINDYAGLSRRSPLLAVCMAVFMVSLIGLPPLAGFNAKLMVILALADNGGWWWSLVVVILINTALSLYYYARVLKVMYLVPSDKPAVAPAITGTAIAVLCAAMLFVMFVGFNPLSNLTTTYGKLYVSRGNALPSATVSAEPTPNPVTPGP
jgi:NADH-quinone oxidoreductase subunit N